MVNLRQQQSSLHSATEEINPIIEGILEITLNSHVNELLVLCETIVDLKNLKDNDFDFSETLELQGWKSFFKVLTSLVYPVLVKQFWIHVVARRDIITSFVMNKKIVVIEKSIANLISHNGYGKKGLQSQN